MRTDIGILGLFVLVWAVGLAGLFGLLPLAGLFDLTLHQFFAIAAFLGWIAGNWYVVRSRKVPRSMRRLLLAIYLLGPPAFIYLCRSLASESVQAAAPLAPLYASAVFGVLFMVPFSLRSRRE